MPETSRTDSVRIARVELRDFRCFSRYELDLSNQITLIAGANGSGKTSLLEAIHYGCYLRSFRSSVPKELIRFGQEGFFVGIDTERVCDQQTTDHRLQVGFATGKRLVKADGKRIGTYKELIDHLRVICLTEDDLELVKGSPQARRLFLDQALLLQNPDYGQQVRHYRQVLNNRNALLRGGAWRADTYGVLTEQLWSASYRMEEARSVLLAALADALNGVLATHFDDQLRVALRYRSTANGHHTFAEFEKELSRIEPQERRFGRSVFGAHLDDFAIDFCQKSARCFASRGQQKLMTMLFKVAQIELVCRVTGVRPAFLIDDFMTDFDESIARKLLQALHDYGLQLVFTSPSFYCFLSNTLLDMGASRVDVSN